jgi:hypothetical protein
LNQKHLQNLAGLLVLRELRRNYKNSFQNAMNIKKRNSGAGSGNELEHSAISSNQLPQSHSNLQIVFLIEKYARA